MVVQHLALGRLPDQLLARRFDHLGQVFDNLPLRRRWQWNSQLALQFLQPVERHAASVLELRDHRARCLVVLFRTHALWLLRRKHLPAGATTQPFQRIDSGRQRRLSNNPHQHFWLLLPIHIALAAIRTTLAMLQVLMRNRDLLRPIERFGSIASVARFLRRVGI